jgi:hypothetical protein
MWKIMTRPVRKKRGAMAGGTCLIAGSDERPRGTFFQHLGGTTVT